MEDNETERKESKILDHECRLRELSDSINHNNIRIIGASEEEITGAEISTLMWGRKQTAKFRRHREVPSKSTKAGQRQDIFKLTKYRNEEKNAKCSKTKEFHNLQGKTHEAG